MTYPDGIDALVNVNATDSLALGGHAARHNSVNTALGEVKDLLNGGSAGQVLIAAGSAAPPIWGTGGKILQVVRATDSTNRSTTSTSYVDVTGMSVTITPQKSNSVILIYAVFLAVGTSSSTGDQRGIFRISDSSDNPLTGAENAQIGTVNYSFAGAWEHHSQQFMLGYVTPATDEAVTYKLRFRTLVATTTLFSLNGEMTGQMYAIEVSA
jgi:hypothetical protein